MTRDLCLKVVSLAEIQCARGGFCCEFAQCPGHSHTFPLCGRSNHQQVPWKDPAFRREVWVPHDPPIAHSLQAWSNGKARKAMEGGRREGETEHLILSVLCLILSTLSWFANVCTFSLPNLTASWKVKGLLDQQIISQALNLQVIGKKATKQKLGTSTPNTALWSQLQET